MIDLQETLAEVAPEQSILLTYTLGLTQLDHALLPVLQAEGDGRVTVVADQVGIEAAFAERATSYGPGVRYRLLPFKVPSGKAFHPKVYLVGGSKGARLIVSSGNLTLYGFRENLEIADVAHVGPEDSGDQHLFAQALGFMDRLAELEPAMGSLLSVDVEAMRTRLGPWSSETEPSSTSALLHSLDFSLIEQVTERLPADNIDRIFCVSPFFDGGGHLLRELCHRFPNAEMAVVGPEEDRNDLDGRALADLNDRIRFSRLLEVRGAKRRLHGKLFAFLGDSGVWTVAGSANATRAAWLGVASEPRGGNVEVVVLREHQDARLVDELRAELRCESVALDTLRFDAESFTEAARTRDRLVLIHAEAAGQGRLTATLRVGSEPKLDETTFRVRVEGRLGMLEAEADVDFNPATETLSVSSQVDLRAFQEDVLPIVCWVEATHPDGTLESARTWLERPDLLTLSSRERRIQNAIARAKVSGAVGETEIEDLSGALSEFLTQIAKRQGLGEPGETKGPGDRPTTHGGQSDPNDSPDREIANPGEFTLSVSEMAPRRSGARGGNMSEILRQVAGVFRKEFESAPSEGEESVADFDGSEPEPRSRTGTGRRHDTIRPALHDEIQSTVVEAFLEGLASDRYAPDEIVDFGNAIGWLLVRLSAIQLEDTNSQNRDRTDHRAARSAQYLTRLMRALFSLRGAARGTPEGRLIDTWMVDPSSIESALSAETAEDFLVLASVASLLSSATSLGLGPVAGGLRLLMASTGEQPEPSTVEDRLYERASHIAEGYGDSLSPEDLMKVITEARSSTAPVRKIAEWWEPLFYLAGDGSNPKARRLARTLVSEQAPDLLRVIDGLRKRGDNPIVVADLAETGKVCSHCREGIPVNDLQRLWDPERPYAQCQVCGFIIAPFDPSSDLASRLIRALRHVEEEE